MRTIVSRPHGRPAEARLGYWASLITCALSLAYAVPQLAQVAGLVPDPLDRILIFAPSLLLAPAFVLTLACAYICATSKAEQVWRLGALCLGILYAGLASIVYVNQLGVVIPRELRSAPLTFREFACCAFQAPMTAVDLLGYTYMALSLMLLAPSYRPKRLRIVLIINGALAPALILQLAWPSLIVVGALWLVTFPVAMLMLAGAFARRDA